MLLTQKASEKRNKRVGGFFLEKVIDPKYIMELNQFNQIKQVSLQKDHCRV